MSTIEIKQETKQVTKFVEDITPLKIPDLERQADIWKRLPISDDTRREILEYAWTKHLEVVHEDPMEEMIRRSKNKKVE